MGILEEILVKIERLENKIDKLNKDDSISQDNQGVFDKTGVADYLSISEEKVYDLWRNQKLSYVKIGTRKVSTIEQLQQYIKDNSVEASAFKNNIKSI